MEVAGDYRSISGRVLTGCFFVSSVCLTCTAFSMHEMLHTLNSPRAVCRHGVT